MVGYGGALVGINSGRRSGKKSSSRMEAKEKAACGAGDKTGGNNMSSNKRPAESWFVSVSTTPILLISTPVRETFTARN